jgi:hypothetical protein
MIRAKSLHSPEHMACPVTLIRTSGVQNVVVSRETAAAQNHRTCASSTPSLDGAQAIIYFTCFFSSFAPVSLGKKLVPQIMCWYLLGSLSKDMNAVNY